jgi:hypothetical protein
MLTVTFTVKNGPHAALLFSPFPLNVSLCVCSRDSILSERRVLGERPEGRTGLRVALACVR